MRLLHTSDWHLGRTLHGLSIIDAQRDALDHIVATAREKDVDAVLVSGDVYDRAVPPVEAVQLFAETLRCLSKICPVIVSSGNHDSAIRLGFGADLFRDRLHIRTRVDQIDEPVVLSDESGPVLVYPIPYLDPDSVRRKLAEEPLPRSHEHVMAAALDRVRTDVARRESEAGAPLRTVVMAHAFVGGRGESASRSDSERDIRVGGVEIVPTTVFDGITYTALGHLHGAQEPSRGPAGFVRYSGSPLRYSFSEAKHTKSVTLVDLGPDGLKSVSAVAVPQPRDMVELRGGFRDLLDDPDNSAHAQSWVKVVVTDPIRPDHMYDELTSRFPNVLSVHHQPDQATVTVGSIVVSPTRDPLDVVADFVRAARQADITEAEHEVVREAYEALRREEGSA